MREPTIEKKMNGRMQATGIEMLRWQKIISQVGGACKNVMGGRS